jgi:hypothetical protein
VLERGALEHHAQAAPSADAFAHLGPGLERPAALAVQGARLDATTHEVAAAGAQRLERALDAVEDRAEEPRSELDVEGHPRAFHGCAGRKAGGVLVHLDRRDPARQLDHLSHDL